MSDEQPKTLRDEFAIAALPLFEGRARTAKGIAFLAYELADAMMAERKQDHDRTT